MTYSNEAPLAPHWVAFNSLWRKVAIALSILLVLLWLLGYGPGGKPCQATGGTETAANDGASVSSKTTAAIATAGEYRIYLLASEREGDTAREMRTLVVGEGAERDGAKPISRLDDAAIVQLILGDGYITTAEIEEIDGRMIVAPGDAVSPTKPWQYVVTFFVTDAAGHPVTEIRTLIVEEVASQ